jgi:hypothetical protein
MKLQMKLQMKCWVFVERSLNGRSIPFVLLMFYCFSNVILQTFYQLLTPVLDVYAGFLAQFPADREQVCRCRLGVC